MTGPCLYTNGSRFRSYAMVGHKKMIVASPYFSSKEFNKDIAKITTKG
jgi:hypothetical protein